MSKTNTILLGVGTLGLGLVIYYNWDWINVNVLGNPTYGYSSSFGTETDIVVLDETQTSIVLTGKEAITQPDGGLISPNTNFDYVTGSQDSLINVQVSWVNPGTYQFFILKGNISSIDVEPAITQILEVYWNFGGENYGPYSGTTAPVITFPSTGIYPCSFSVIVGSPEEGGAASINGEYDLQVIIA